MFKSKISGIGSFLPEKILSNHDLEKLVETNHDWIVQRTGIVIRHVVSENENTSDLIVNASNQALADACLSIEDIDLIIVATVTGDYKIPSTACVVQAKLGARNIMAFDINAACTGFIYNIQIADQFIKTGLYKNILICGAESLSRLMNYKDRETCILFGDAAGAFVISRAEAHEDNVILTSHCHAEGRLAELLWAEAGGTKVPFSREVLEAGTHFLKMNGKEIFKNATRTMAQCAKEALTATGYSLDQINWVVPHQANLRITEAVSNQLDYPMNQIISSVHETGNTSAASIPVAFHMAVKENKIKRGDIIMLVAFGAGLTSGSAILKY